MIGNYYFWWKLYHRQFVELLLILISIHWNGVFMMQWLKMSNLYCFALWPTRGNLFLFYISDVPDPPVGVRLSSCHSRLAEIQWKLSEINENHSPVLQFIIESNSSFDPGSWYVAKTQLPRTKYYQRIAVSPWGNYSFRVIAQNKVGHSKPSAPTALVCHMPPDVPHHNPGGVCTKNLLPHMLIITWKVGYHTTAN